MYRSTDILYIHIYTYTRLS